MAVPGSVVGVGKLITPGGQQGPKGDAGTAANVPLADITQNGLLRQNTGKTTDFVDGTNNCQPIAPQIWSVRLRSFSAIGNPTFEVTQRYPGGASTAGNGFNADRWFLSRAGTSAVLVGQGLASGAELVVPGTSFQISRAYLRTSLTTAQASLGAGDYLILQQSVEGPYFRELQYDVHSISLLVRSSVAGLKFSVVLRDSVSAQSLCKLCTIPAANTWTLITLPNIPVWSASGSFSSAPGALAYTLLIALAAGTTFTASAADTWQNGNFFGAPGMSNFAASPVNSTFDIAFIQHEPGAVCSTPMDKPFSQNLDECLRYYTKSYPYGSLPGTASSGQGSSIFPALAGQQPYCWISFKKVMAKAPTVIGYSPVTGAINTMRDVTPGGVDRAITAVVNTGDEGFSGFNITGANAANWIAQFNYTADIGW